jgi:hypothetical protein
MKEILLNLLLALSIWGIVGAITFFIYIRKRITTRKDKFNG